MLILESYGGDWTYRRETVPFDTEAEIAEFYESGLAQKADVWSRAYIAALREGRNYSDECVKLVKKMCAEENKPFKCEEIWQRAAKILGI
jgi:hypothetical protein